MTIETLLQSVAATGPMAGVLLYIAWYQTQRVKALEAEVRDMYQVLLGTLRGTNGKDSHHDA